MGYGWGVVASAGLVLVLPVATESAAEAALSSRPRGKRIRVEPPESLSSPNTSPGGGPHIIYLNRCIGGVTVVPGVTDDPMMNQSSIIANERTLPAYPYGDASWDEIVQDVQEMFSPFNILVTDQDPSPMLHDEVFICGRGQDAGFGGSTAGIAPYSCDPLPTAITFAFPETIGNFPRYTAETAVQEVGHTWGLDHAFVCEDPMTYLEGCGPKMFQDGDYPCGEYAARPCDCGGDTQNTYQHILALFGPALVDDQPPSISIVAPADGSTFAPGEDFAVSVETSDDFGVVSVELYVGGELAGTDEDPPFEGWPIIDPPLGELAFQARAIDAAGNMADSATITVSIGEDSGSSGGTGDTGSVDPSDGGGEGGSEGGGDAETGVDPSGGGSEGDTTGSDPSTDSSGVNPGAETDAGRDPEASGDEAGGGCRMAHRGQGPHLLPLFLLGLLRRRRG